MAELQKNRAAEEDCRGSQVQQVSAHGVGGGGGGIGGKRKIHLWEEEEGQEEVIFPEHIPQAFSHFSYKYSDSTMLVCDLQGVYGDRNRTRGGQVHPAIFELTDPVIHHVVTDAGGTEADKRVRGRTIGEPRGCNTFSGRTRATQRAVCFNLLV